MKETRSRTLLGIGLIILVALAYTWATWQYFTIPLPGGNDFMTYYGAWEAYFEQGYSPYSDEAALYTQTIIYGRAARGSEDENRLVYPFYSGLVHAPFILVEFPLARAIYMVLYQALLIASLGISLALLRWKPPVWLLLLLVGWAILYYPHARGIILGQIAIFGCISLVGALALLQRPAAPSGGRMDLLAGCLLALSTMKPNLVFLLVPFLLLWGLARRRWAFVGGFLGCFALLCAVSFLLLPTWPFEFWSNLNRYKVYGIGDNPVYLLTHQALPSLGAAGEWGITLLLAAGMLWSWWRTLRRGGEAHFYWALSITLIMSTLIVLRSSTSNYVMLLLPTIWVLAALDRRGFAGRKRWGRALVVLVLLCSFAGLWWLHFATVQGNQEQAIVFIPTPVLLGLVFVAGRAWLEADACQAGLAL